MAIAPEPDTPLPGPEDEPKRLSDRGVEESSKWTQRLEDASKAWEDGEDERALYRDAERNVFPPLITEAVDVSAVENNLGLGPQVVLNVLTRVVRRTKAKSFDHQPSNKFPRRVKGMETLCEGIEGVLTKVSERALLPNEFRDGVSNIYTEGGFGVFTGMPGFPTRDEIDALGKGAEEIVEEVAAEKHVPSRLQDHRAIAGSLLNIYGDPDISTNADPVELEKVGAAAQDHADLEDVEQAQTVRFAKNAIEFRRLPFGRGLLWDAAVSARRDWRWMGRCITTSRRHLMELAGTFRPEWVARLPAFKIDEDRWGYRSMSPYLGEIAEEDEDVQVQFWEIYDKWYQTRHFVAEGVDGYGEVDERFPYWRRDGSGPSVRGFFPFALCVPNKTGGDRAADTFGVPGFRAGFHQQVELIKAGSAKLAVMKRAAIDIYGCSSEQWAQIGNAVREGKGGRVLPFPPGTDIAKMWQKLQMEGPIKELGEEEDRKLSQCAIAFNFPLSELTTSPQEETLGQTEIAKQTGSTTLNDEQKQMQVTYGECLDIAWDLIREHWSVEDVNAELGEDFSSVWDAWVSSPLSDERITTTFGPESLDNDPHKAERLMALYEAAKTEIDPLTGMPAFDSRKILNKISKALGEGELPPYQPTPEEMMAAQGMGGGMGGAMPGGGGAPLPGPGNPNGPRTKKRGKGGAGAQQQPEEAVA